ncbi:hypothetical protein C5167_035418 [Papaver somniferum]|uniref:Uncharacterized protein n=1 Tax=Papaver somniferum TaxID=3469 RepID=A0A4Y7KFR9_PAPSO|nr:hypothetical protein C5167_035418 [Papaver somniferum]
MMIVLMVNEIGAINDDLREYEVSSVRYYVRDTFSVPLESVYECKLVCKKHFIRQLHRLYDKYGNNDDIAATEEVDLDDIAGGCLDVCLGHRRWICGWQLLDVEVVRVTGEF